MAATLLPSENNLNLTTLETQMLQLALSQAETVGELTALIINHTHLEIMQAFEQLSSVQQQRVQELWEVKISEGWK
ncbi:conserved hypothetical protein [Planktothrix sp. PCC 11201]|uniref:hypothetical protein n=1 Tax=Planktothrix sp. PCC 11201 TaxID=1729650 RepID=UPI0009234154|nr:hypothetical protein [Planktothrix sp. PCC 11201]SKB15840.1 conserved hypothetical protein [Planktothrix sp. PCC 11201]